MSVAATTNNYSQSSAAAAALFAEINGQGAKTSAADSTDFAKDRFLTLLTAQLKNQDPLNPMDNAQMTSQMAQISTVDGIERLNATLEKLIQSSAESQSLQMAGMVGRGVLVPGDDMRLTEDGAIGGVLLEKPVDDVAVEIYDMNGLLMRTLNLGPLEAGSHAFGWDGLTNAGEQAVAGKYRFSINARLGEDPIDAEQLQFGVVDGIVRSNGESRLSIGDLGSFSTGDIKQIL